MQLTQEQLDIIGSSGNIKINAVAGSGKTTTIIEYAKAQPKSSRILYIAFNKSVKIEAIKKFAAKGLHNVKVETAHSLAFSNVIFGSNYKVSAAGYKPNEIAEILSINSGGSKYAEYILANHISRFAAYFCNSDKQKVQDLNYLDVVTESKAREIVSKFYSFIESRTRTFLAKMNKGEIEITHDFYLKKFQLSEPKLNYDVILFDEGQDASASMLDVFLKQSAVKVIVGDTHQQIYGWRYAINSLEKVDFKTYNLTHSFRFKQDIADLACEVINRKSHIGKYESTPIYGVGSGDVIKTKAVLARTNLGLLLRAIELVTEKRSAKKIYFEGNINSYTYADDGTSLYDVLNFSNNKRKLVKDPLLKSMKDMKELEDYVRKTGERQLGMMVEIVKEYGSKIPAIISMIKAMHVEDKEKADLIFSTVHKCKGMEYDSVHLVNDFITLDEILKLKENKKIDEMNSEKLNQEINLLYVALTRTKNRIYFPKELMPDDHPASPNIIVLDIEKEKKKRTDKSYSYEPVIDQSKYTSKVVPSYKKNIPVNSDSYFHKAKEKSKSAYLPWTNSLDNELAVLYTEGKSLPHLAKYFQRTSGAIRSRILKLGLDE